MDNSMIKINVISFRPKWAERFLSKVSAQNENGCMLWTASKFQNGYGRIRAGIHVSSHRAAYELAYGGIPIGLNVCHKCDVRACCNPMHLFLGTHAENMADREGKGRTARGEKSGSRLYPERLPSGERHYRCKLTSEKIMEIIAMRGTGISQRKAARQFRVSKTHIGQIWSGKRRKKIHQCHVMPHVVDGPGEGRRSD